MSTLLLAPKRREEVLKWAKQITEYVKESTPRAGSGVKVKRLPGGTVLSSRPFFPDWYNFEVINDQTYNPVANNRRIAIRGGLMTRAAFGIHDLQITAPCAGENFGAAGGPGGGSTIDDVSICADVIPDLATWVVYLGLVNTGSAAPGNPINPTNLVAFYADAGRPDDPELGEFNYNWLREIATVTNLNGRLYYKQTWRGGNIKDFMLIPDGQQMYSDLSQSVESVDYVRTLAGDPDRDGHLQSRQAHELLVVGSNVTKYESDFATPHFDYSATGKTKVYYSRLDTHDAESWAYPWGKSLEVSELGPENGTIMQLRNFSRMTGGVNTQEANDAMATYVDVDANGSNEITYRWPVTAYDDLIDTQRPFNDADVAANFTQSYIYQIGTDSAGSLTSYGHITTSADDLTVDNAALSIHYNGLLDDRYFEVDQITVDVINPGLYHTLTDPEQVTPAPNDTLNLKWNTSSGYGLLLEGHDERYLKFWGASNGSAEYGGNG